MDPGKMYDFLLKMMDFNFYLRLLDGKYTWDSNYLPLFCTFLMFLPISQPRNTKWWGSAWTSMFVGRAIAGVVRNSIRMSHRSVMSNIWLQLSPTSFVFLTYRVYRLPGANSQLLIPQVSDTSTSSSVTAPGRPLNAKMRSIITSSACRKSR